MLAFASSTINRKHLVYGSVHPKQPAIEECSKFQYVILTFLLLITVSILFHMYLYYRSDFGKTRFSRLFKQLDISCINRDDTSRFRNAVAKWAVLQSHPPAEKLLTMFQLLCKHLLLFYIVHDSFRRNKIASCNTIPGRNLPNPPDLKNCHR